MKNMRGPGPNSGQDHSISWIGSKLNQACPLKKCSIIFSQKPPLGVPVVDEAELHQQNRGLQSVHAAVPTDLIVIVATTHSMHPQEADPFSDGIQSGCDHAGVSAGTEILGGVEAESGRVAQSARLAPIPAGSERLGSILDQHHAVLLPELLEAVPIDGLAIEMNRQNSPNGGSGFQACLRRSWIQVEGFRIDIRE